MCMHTLAALSLISLKTMSLLKFVIALSGLIVVLEDGYSGNASLYMATTTAPP